MDRVSVNRSSVWYAFHGIHLESPRAPGPKPRSALEKREPMRKRRPDWSTLMARRSLMPVPVTRIKSHYDEGLSLRRSSEIDPKVGQNNDSTCEKKALAPVRDRRWAGTFLRKLTIVWMVLAASGCSYMTSGGDVWFSEDGTMAVYVCARQWDLPLPPEVPTIRSKIWVRWCKLTKPRQYRTVEIGVFGKDWGGWDVKNRVHPIFSPDNRYLAVACPRQLVILDCLAQQRRILTGPDEVVTSLIWLDEGELAYASCTKSPGRRHVGTSTNFWRQGVDQSPEDRTLIFSHENSNSCPEKGLSLSEWPRERWSPDRRFVLFRAQGFRGDLTLVDVVEGTSRVIAAGGYNFEGISWKSDGSAAACVGFSTSVPMMAFLIDPRTDERQDFSEEFNKAFGSNSRFSAPRIPPQWTPGDQYLVVNDSETGGCLVRPHPWAIIPVAKRLVDHLTKDSSIVLAEEYRNRLPWIFWQPAKGWVRVWVQLQEQGYRRATEYWVDYSGRSFVPVEEPSAPGGGWKMTPDGKHAVKLERHDKLIVRALLLPNPSIQ